MAVRAPRVPVFIWLMAVSACLMLVPALHAALTDAYRVSRAFFYPALLFMAFAAVLGLAVSANPRSASARGELLTLFAAYTVLPLMLAVPLAEAVPGVRLADAWWEMISAITTTGATIFAPDALPPSVHLWRALVGWFGGAIILVAAFAVLAPLNLGGFEVLSASASGAGISGGRVMRPADAGSRVARAALNMLPAYGALTAVLWVGLFIAGDDPLTALCHAMGTLSTSGISPIGGLAEARSGVPGEVLIFLFLFFGLSAALFPAGGRLPDRRKVMSDPELRLGLVIVAVVTAALFLRQWYWVSDFPIAGSPRALAEALWGALFTVLSFLTTTGYFPQEWRVTLMWSGIASPELLLSGLAIFGGGVATTAGGVQLMRLYAMLLQGQRELGLLVHPHSIAGGGEAARRLRREGALVAWLFFMLFAMSIAAVMLALALTGVGFEAATVLAVSALTTTGPLASVAGAVPDSWAGLERAARAILAGAMVLGRLETLAVIALLNPALWRR